jgi:hypothetical protein
MREEATGGWRKLHNKGHYILYSSQKSRSNQGSPVLRKWEIINAYKTVAGISEVKTPLGGYGRRLEDNIQMDLKVQSEPYASSSEQSRTPGSCEHCNEPSNFMKGEYFLDRLSDYQRVK